MSEKEDAVKAIIDLIREEINGRTKDIAALCLGYLEGKHGFKQDEPVILNGKPGFVDYSLPELGEGLTTSEILIRVRFPNSKEGVRPMYRFVKGADKLERVNG